jgi:RNA polymerase sigma-70 factor, ECF subfamily
MFGSEHRVRDQEELRQALAELLPRLRRFGRAMTGSVSEGDDLAQAACERALKRLAQLRVETRLDSWMYTMMRRMWIDEMRSRRIRQHEPIDAAEEVIGEEVRRLPRAGSLSRRYGEPLPNYLTSNARC